MSVLLLIVTFLSKAQLPGQPSEARSYQDDSHHSSKRAGEVNSVLARLTEPAWGLCTHHYNLSIDVCRLVHFDIIMTHQTMCVD